MTWASGITQIVEVADLGTSPAMVNRETGVVYINARFKGRLTKDQWLFILLHEEGHLKLKTLDENAVDNWAFNEYVKRGGSLKQSVFALTRVLSGSTPEHYQRANNQLIRAKNYEEYGT